MSKNQSFEKIAADKRINGQRKPLVKFSCCVRKKRKEYLENLELR